MTRNRPPLLVAAGIIVSEGKILVGQRRKNDRHALKWEFPGGKVEHGETPRQALVRELKEELQIEARIGGELARYEYDYPSGSRVHLLFYVVRDFTGIPQGLVFEQIQWVEPPELRTFDFVEGDLDFVTRLSRGDFQTLLPS